MRAVRAVDGGRGALRRLSRGGRVPTCLTAGLPAALVSPPPGHLFASAEADGLLATALATLTGPTPDDVPGPHLGTRTAPAGAARPASVTAPAVERGRWGPDGTATTLTPAPRRSTPGKSPVLAEGPVPATAAPASASDGPGHPGPAMPARLLAGSDAPPPRRWAAATMSVFPACETGAGPSRLARRASTTAAVTVAGHLERAPAPPWDLEPIAPAGADRPAPLGVAVPSRADPPSRPAAAPATASADAPWIDGWDESGAALAGTVDDAPAPQGLLALASWWEGRSGPAGPSAAPAVPPDRSLAATAFPNAATPTAGMDGSAAWPEPFGPASADVVLAVRDALEQVLLDEALADGLEMR